MLTIQKILLPKSPKEATNNAIMKGIFFGTPFLWRSFNRVAMFANKWKSKGNSSPSC